MKPASTVAALLLGLIGIAHVLRLAFRTEVTVGGRSVPMSVSIVGCVAALALSLLVLREARATR